MGKEEKIIKEELEAKPFLRWAGGKKWLTDYVSKLLQKGGYKNYHEPFLGGGAIFFSLPKTSPCFLSDLNEELIQTYEVVRDNPQKLIKELKSYINSEEFYYQIREQVSTDPVESAARFIFLNQTSFNGIYRVNLKGIYNVPYGYRKKDFVAEYNLLNASHSLKKANLVHSDFEGVKSNIRKGDVIFLDPPYTVSHNNNGFIKYNQHLFSLEDQHRLSSLIDFIKRKGAFYILSNAAHAVIAEIFEKGDRRIELTRTSLIGGINAQRGNINEYLFTNYPK